MFYLTTHSTHFIYSYMASDIWLRTILIVRKETRFRHIDYSFRLTARVLLYSPSHRQDSTYHGLHYTSRGALVGTRNISMAPLHEGSIRRPIAPWANALTTELHLAPTIFEGLNSLKLLGVILVHVKSKRDHRMRIWTLKCKDKLTKWPRTWNGDALPIDSMAESSLTSSSKRSVDTLGDASIMSTVCRPETTATRHGH